MPRADVGEAIHGERPKASCRLLPSDLIYCHGLVASSAAADFFTVIDLGIKELQKQQVHLTMLISAVHLHSRSVP